tara:strand:+ start:472 stop:1317 length:846 start_codon:yes stop_codon:yes gene_type:complete
MNLLNAINYGTRILQNNSIKSAKLDSEILMSSIIEKERSFIFLNHNKNIKVNHFKQFKKLINKRSRGEPVAYLIGKKDFWNYEFKIDKNVLVPRPDSELIVEEVLKQTKNKHKLKLLDIGIGSGCLLLSILRETKDFQGVGIDLSKKCINLSKINAINLEIDHRVKFFKTDVDNFNYGKYDLIVSNPPYINQYDLQNLDKEVVNFEPKLSLDGGLDGLSVIRKVIKKASELIKLNGILILEIGFDQKERVKKILINKGFYINKVIKDYANNDRCIVSTKNN